MLNLSLYFLFLVLVSTMPVFWVWLLFLSPLVLWPFWTVFLLMCSIFCSGVVSRPRLNVWQKVRASGPRRCSSTTKQY